MTPSGCTISSLIQLESPKGFCNFIVSLILYGLYPYPRFVLLTYYIASGTPFLCPFSPPLLRLKHRLSVAGWYPAECTCLYFQFGCYLFWCPFTRRPCITTTGIQSLAGILQCPCLFLVRVLPFLVPLYPRPCVPTTEMHSMVGILQCTCHFFQSQCYISGARLPTPIASQAQRFSRWLVACSARLSLFPSLGATFSGAPFL